MPKAFKKCIFQRTKKTFPQIRGFQVRPRTADWDIHLWAVEFLLWSAPALRHTGMQIVLCAFTDFPRVLLTFPNSIHGPSDSLFPFFSAPRDVRANFLHRWLYFHLRHGSVAALAADILPLFSWSRSHHSLSQIVPFHITFSCHPPQPHQLARLMERVKLACFLPIPATRNHFQRSLLFAMEKKQERILFCVVSSPQWQRLTYYETSSCRQRGERVHGTPIIQECIRGHTHLHIQQVCPVIDTHPVSPSSCMLDMCLWGSPFFFLWHSVKLKAKPAICTAFDIVDC